ncbi:MAG TPA: hypothetical protein VFS19_05565 [Planctomycetota bacterium]|nr:hypothetical protein [Planctomycetota bacterium]
MADPKILRGIYKDGPVVASAVIEPDGSARLMVKGAEPLLAGDPAFLERLKKIASECRGKLEGAQKVQIQAILDRAALAEQVNIKPEDLAEMKVEKVVLLDAACGLPVRVCDEDPAPVSLSYESLRADLTGSIPDQPGLVDVPTRYTRKLHRDLTDDEKKVYEMAVQRAGRGLMKLVIVEDGDLKLAVALKDLPPARARSVILPLSELGKEVKDGLSVEQLANKLEIVRAG